MKTLGFYMSEFFSSIIQILPLRKPGQYSMPGDLQEEALVQRDARQGPDCRYHFPFPTGIHCNSHSLLIHVSFRCFRKLKGHDDASYFVPHRSSPSICEDSTTAPRRTWLTWVGCCSELLWTLTGHSLSWSPGCWMSWFQPTSWKSCLLTSGRR